MTAFQTSGIPSGIDTLEELVLWGQLALYELNKGVTYKESQGSPVDSGLAPLIDFSIINTADNTQRAICRTSVELNAAWTSDGTQPLWNFAEAMSNAVLPNTYKAA
ncbi:hypothetical protein PN498_18280 [Oscillatoria sp. CS-180]|uniref:hypothetical protein n=1 Tax=Oscillatoria sp. CS-180 TaxID=3021720 RepID=UPI00232FA4F4|nr:hypothetical protein [Oscillatoria sp. CS-180]MDB9527947.1 hypothetical protein [Oscillatoria sp. CS-180]